MKCKFNPSCVSTLKLAIKKAEWALTYWRQPKLIANTGKQSKCSKSKDFPNHTHKQPSSQPGTPGSWLTLSKNPGKKSGNAGFPTGRARYWAWTASSEQPQSAEHSWANSRCSVQSYTPAWGSHLKTVILGKKFSPQNFLGLSHVPKAIIAIQYILGLCETLRCVVLILFLR